MSRYHFINAERGHYPVRRLCQVSGVLASGYYACQTVQQQALDQQTPAWKTALVKTFGFSQRRYGPRQLQVTLRENRHAVGRQRLRTTNSTHGLRCAPNHLPGQPKSTRANQVWVSDITYLLLTTGSWAYLCAF